MSEGQPGENNPFAVEQDGEFNPYAPTSNVSPVEAATDVEGYRKKYLSHEASVKSIGALYMIGAVFLIPMGLISLGAVGVGNLPGADKVVLAVLAMVYLSLGVFQAFVAVGLRRLRSWARIAAAILSAIGLIGFPIGTLISAYFLYLLLSEKGSIVFSDEYQRVIEQTPHIKYKTSVVVWIFLGLLVIVLGMGVLALVLGA